MNLKADLAAAVEANIVSEEQGARLAEFLRERRETHEKEARASLADAFVLMAPALLLLAGGALASRYSR